MRPLPTYKGDSLDSLVVQVWCPVLAWEVEQHADEVIRLSSGKFPGRQVSVLLNDSIENLVEFVPQLRKLTDESRWQI